MALTDIGREDEAVGSIEVVRSLAKQIYVLRPLEVNFLIVRYPRDSPIDVGMEAKAEAFRSQSFCQVLIWA